MANTPTPYAWAMPDPAALAFRFAVPNPLGRYTAVTVAPGQAGYFFLNDQIHRCDEPGLYLLTGSMIHTLEEAEAIQRHGGEAVQAYNAQLLLFDLRPKLSPTMPLEMPTAEGEKVTVNLAVKYHVERVEKLYQSGATFQPGADGDVLTQSDPLIADALRRAAEAAAVILAERTAQMENAAAAEQLFMTDNALKAAMCARIAGILAPVGLMADAVHLSVARRQCPYCGKALSLTELQEHRCYSEAGGCGRQLHTCPACETIVGSERDACPTCGLELLWCDACQTYRRVEKGRFCPVCRRACYPLPPREFLTLM